ncbi:MAG: hypothetical protein ABSD63_11455 [Candidatus Korobacteraceae bacterium]|jgi:hypothetical protein
MGVIGEGVDLLKLVDKGMNADLYKQLGEWIDKVADQQKELEGLRAENARLKECLLFKGLFRRIASHTFVEGDEEEVCSRCAQVDFRPVYLLDMNIDGRGNRATCPYCKTARAGPAPPISRKKAEENARRRADSG